LSSGVTLINAKAVAAERGIELVESHSSRARNYTSLLSLQVHTDSGLQWVEGAVLEHVGPRLVLVDGVPVDAPLEGTQILIKNNDQPGVIGAVGTVLGRHGINIASFALGRSPTCAIGVVGIDNGEGTAVTGEVLAELRRIPAVQSAELVRL
jgi:D-3-phosphoglycerate dehydrogenase